MRLPLLLAALALSACQSGDADGPARYAATGDRAVDVDAALKAPIAPGELTGMSRAGLESCAANEIRMKMTIDLLGRAAEADTLAMGMRSFVRTTREEEQLDAMPYLAELRRRDPAGADALHAQATKEAQQALAPRVADEDPMTALARGLRPDRVLSEGCRLEARGLT